MNDSFGGAAFTLLRLTGQIGELDSALVLRAFDIRDRTNGQQPPTQQMRTHRLAFGQANLVNRDCTASRPTCGA